MHPEKQLYFSINNMKSTLNSFIKLKSGFMCFSDPLPRKLGLHAPAHASELSWRVLLSSWFPIGIQAVTGFQDAINIDYICICSIVESICNDAYFKDSFFKITTLLGPAKNFQVLLDCLIFRLYSEIFYFKKSEAIPV